MCSSKGLHGMTGAALKWMERLWCFSIFTATDIIAMARMIWVTIGSVGQL